MCWNCPDGPNEDCEKTCSLPKDIYGKISTEIIYDIKYSVRRGWSVYYDEKMPNKFVLLDGRDKHWFTSREDAIKHLDTKEYLT